MERREEKAKGGAVRGTNTEHMRSFAGTIDTFAVTFP
jgi:hypothetical protein